MKKYTPKVIEGKWQKVWDETKLYEVTEDPNKEKIYATPMLPYPSGAGLHVGHVRNYSIADAVARFHRQRGYNVMSNIGWDAFGLPAENYAIKTGTPPAVSTAANIENFEVQLRRLGISYAWDRLVNTMEPEYYKWTQWVFTQLFNDDLAYQGENLQWWCTKCKTVIANEQVENGKCWRHNGEDDPLVERRLTKQWFFKITKYADPLLDELENLDWPDSITVQQRNWIGRSHGAEIDFEVVGSDDTIRVFTTRPDTIYGATFMVLAPENPLLETIVSDDQEDEVVEYVKQSVKKTDIDRMDEGKIKTGVFTGAYAINPASEEKIPIWVSDFVLGSYGTGAIMAVPAHDQRDFEFATKFELPIIQVVMPIEDDNTNPPKNGLEDVRRDTVIVHLKDRSTGKYALLEWHESLEGIVTGIMGGIEQGQTPEEAARAEIREEAAIEDVEIVQEQRWITGARYCASHKNQNRTAVTTVLRAEVEDLSKQGKIAEAEKKLHALVWVDESEVLGHITPDHQKMVWQQLQQETAISGEGEIMNSGKYDGMSAAEARDVIVADLAKKKVASEKINYRIRDWLISRQRYWGAPIPIIHCAGCGPVAVPEKDLPVELPAVENYQPTGDGVSVLAGVEDWVNVDCPDCGKPAKRETDTMDGYACSSWYLHRYTDANNDKMAWDPDKVNYWFPVDYYFGGDHAVSHLLYVRFWNHYFVDKGLVSADNLEPIKRLVFNGYINAADGRKMSKSLGNVVDPLDIIDSGYGADALRMFELFAGPYDQDVQWNPNGVPGTYRFLQRVWTLAQELLESESSELEADPEKSVMLDATMHKAIKKVTHDLENYRFNTAIAACMETVNNLNKLKVELPMPDAYKPWHRAISQLVQLLAPFAPHVSEELWEQLGYDKSVHVDGWPVWDEELVKEDLLTIVVQVNGKVRANLEVESGATEAEITALAEADRRVQKFIVDHEVVRKIYVPNKLVNFVIK